MALIAQPVAASDDLRRVIATMEGAELLELERFGFEEEEEKCRRLEARARAEAEECRCLQQEASVRARGKAEERRQQEEVAQVRELRRRPIIPSRNRRPSSVQVCPRRESQARLEAEQQVASARACHNDEEEKRRRRETRAREEAEECRQRKVAQPTSAYAKERPSVHRKRKWEQDCSPYAQYYPLHTMIHTLLTKV